MLTQLTPSASPPPKKQHKTKILSPSDRLVQDDAQLADDGRDDDHGAERPRVHDEPHPRARDDEHGEAQAEEARDVRLLVSANKKTK